MLWACQITNGFNRAGIEPPFCLIETLHLRETSHCKPHPGCSLTKLAPQHVGPAPVPLMVMPSHPWGSHRTAREREEHSICMTQCTEVQQPNEHPVVCRRHRQSQAEV